MMEYKNYCRIALLLLSGLLLLSSCLKDEVGSLWLSDYDDTELCEIGIETKAVADLLSSGDYTSTTYRAQLFYRGDGYPRLDSLMTPYTGTYCNPKGSNTWLTPCAVNADYEYDASANPPDSSVYGLRAGRYHNYYMFLNSPASEYVEYDRMLKQRPGSSLVDTMKYFGLPYLRGGDPKDHPAVSPGLAITTSGLMVQNKYLYSVNDTLIEYRSRVAFSVRCGDGIDHANFKKLEIKGLRNNAVFRPFTKDFFFVDSPENYEDVLVYESTSPNGIRLDRIGSSPDDYAPGVSQSLTGLHTNEHLADNRDNTHFTYILSDDYAATDAGGNYYKTPAYLYITLIGDDGNPMNIDPVPLSYVFKPQKSYFNLITINSVFLTITVVAQSWDVRDPMDISIDDPDYWTMTIGISDWTSKVASSDQNQEINPGIGGDDAPRYDKSTGGVLPGDWNATSGGSSTVDND